MTDFLGIKGNKVYITMNVVACFFSYFLRMQFFLVNALNVMHYELLMKTKKFGRNLLPWYCL